MREDQRDRNWNMQVTALYDYQPEQPDELGFQEGDVLRVLRVQDDGWWSGYSVENPDVIGLFPSNYVQAQRDIPTLKSSKTFADTATTPRPPASSRQRIQQQVLDTPELADENEDDDIVNELRGEYRGHVGAVLQLRKNLEEVERASEAVRDARRQAEREILRHKRSWQERGQQEEGIDVEELNQEENMNRQQHQESRLHNSENSDDDDESAFPHLQGSMHESDHQQTSEVEKDPSDDNGNEAQPVVQHDQTAEVEDTEEAAATEIARTYRKHSAMVQDNREEEREADQQKLSEIAAVCIQRWAAHTHSRQHKRAFTPRRREKEAAANIQKWIRLRWACFWRRRVQIERDQQAAREAQQLEEQAKAELRRAELEDKLRREAEAKEVRLRLAKEEEERQQLERKTAEKERLVLQQELEKQEEEQRRQLHIKAVEEEVQRRFLETEVHKGENDIGPATVSPSAPPRRKVMKKEAAELIKTLVQQQLGETLRDHDAKMDELQRMVARLQTVVRKQTAMLEDSTDQLVNLQIKRQEEQRLPMQTRSNGTGDGSFLPIINSQSSAPRQPIAPSGLRPPRPVMMSKLPVLTSGRRGASCNQSKT